MAKSTTQGKLGKEEFTIVAIRHAQKNAPETGKYAGFKGMFCRSSGYFSFFEEYFGEAPYSYSEKTKKYTGWLIAACAKGTQFVGHPVGSGTWVVYLKAEAPKAKPNKTTEKARNSLAKAIAQAAKA